MIYFLIIFGFFYGFLVCGIPQRKKKTCRYYPTWMSKYAEKKLSELVLPGTHDSLIYTDIDITKYHHNPSTSPFVNILKFFTWVPGMNTKINRWTQTQNSDIYEQLMHGIRCFDIRVGIFNNRSYSIHTFLCSDFSLALIDMAAFLVENRSELIVVRYRADRSLCHDILLEILGNFLIHPSQLQFSPVMYTVRDLLKHGNILLLSDIPEISHFSFENFVYHNWVNTSDTERKIQYVKEDTVQYEPSDDILFNLDWTLTPQTRDTVFDVTDLLLWSSRFNDRLRKYWESLAVIDKRKINIVSVDHEASFSLYEVLYQC